MTLTYKNNHLIEFVVIDSVGIKILHNHDNKIGFFFLVGNYSDAKLATGGHIELCPLTRF